MNQVQRSARKGLIFSGWPLNLSMNAALGSLAGVKDADVGVAGAEGAWACKEFRVNIPSPNIGNVIVQCAPMPQSTPYQYSVLRIMPHDYDTQKPSAHVHEPLKCVDRIASRLMGFTVANACVWRNTCSNVCPVWRKWNRNNFINHDSMFAQKICSKRSSPSGL